RALTLTDAALASALATRVLRIDPSDTLLQSVSAQLAAAATALERQRSDDARRVLESGTSAMARVLRVELPDAPQQPASIDAGRLSGSLVDALRRGRGAR